jgi:tricorn protease-like protein
MESVRSELIRHHEQTGLSLVSMHQNKTYTVSFAKHKLTEVRTLPTLGTFIKADFSDDGRKIAVAFCREPGLTHPTPYSTDCPSGLVLAVMEADGSHLREYPDFADPYTMCWSHDSSKLALIAEDRRKGEHVPFELQVLDLTTKATQVIAQVPDAFVDSQCWSPDDKQVVYTADNTYNHGVSSIYEVDQKMSHEFSKGTRPTWSPDGNWIALMDCASSLSGCKYYAVRPSGNERKLLFKSESATALWWSPDSRFVAYVNTARFFERTPPQQLREMVRLRVRRLEDGSVATFADFFDGDTMDFQWLKFAIPESSPAR